MVSEKLKKSLTRYDSKLALIGYWVGLLTPFVILLVAVVNLWLASRQGSHGGFTLEDFMKTWLEVIDMKREYSYSGLFLAGLHRFNTALFQFSLAIVVSPLVFAAVSSKKRDQEIIKILRKHGEI